MFGRSHRATAIQTALFLLLLPSHNEGTTTRAATQKASSTLRTVLHRINPEHAEFGEDYVRSTQPLSTANPRILEQTTVRSSQPAPRESTIVTIDVSAPTTEIPSSSAATSATDKRHHPEYINSKFEIQDEVKTGNFQEIDEAVTQTDAISLRGDTDVNKDAKKNGDKILATKNANALEEEVEDGNFGPKNEVEIVPFSVTTSQSTLLKISKANETKDIPKERTMGQPTVNDTTTTEKPVTTETAEPKPYPYSKLNKISSTTEVMKEASTEETSAFENTIGRYKPEDKSSVTESSYEKSLPKLKPNHPKRSDPTVSTPDSSTSSSLETNDVTLNVTEMVSPRQPDKSIKTGPPSPSGSTKSLIGNTNPETSSPEPSTEKLSTVTLTTPMTVASTEVLTRDRSHTTSLADVNTSDDKLALESFDRVNWTTPKVEYEIVKLTESTSKEPLTEETESTNSEQMSDPTTLKTTSEEDSTNPRATDEEENTTTTSTTNTLDGDSSEANTEDPTAVTTEPMTPTDSLPISGKHPDNSSLEHTTVAMQESTELPTLQNTNILTTSSPTTTTTQQARIAEVTQPPIVFTSIGPAGVVPTLPRVKIDIEAPVSKVCDNLLILRKDLADLLSSDDMNFSAERVMLDTSQCGESARLPADVTLTTVLVYVVDENGNLDESLTEMLYDMLYKQNPNASFTWPIRSFILVTLPKADSGNAIAVVAVSCVAFICLVLLAGLLFIMRKRQTRFNYGERCRPVSLDAYSLDSVSAYNSVRRKGAARASKRSYGNPTFEDASAIPSHPLNFAGLSSFCEDHNTIGEEFAGIPQVTAKMDELPQGAEVKNRYANVVPLPETRVTLSRLNNDPLTEYINASYVRGPKNAMKYYIACQAPTEATVVDFWRMIWEQQSKVIIMLTDLVENGVEKCTEYIPPSEVTDCNRLFGDFQITLKKRETKEKYAISTLVLKNLENNTFREVYHIWYLWPASGVPSDAAAVIAIILEARALQRGGPEPIVVHCSPGTGRTGTLISLDLGIRQYEITRTVDVPRVVYTIRRDRAGAVQTREQYAFIYKALNFYAMKLAGGALEST